MQAPPPPVPRRPGPGAAEELAFILEALLEQLLLSAARFAARRQRGTVHPELLDDEAPPSTEGGWALDLTGARPKKVPKPKTGQRTRPSDWTAQEDSLLWNEVRRRPQKPTASGGVWAGLSKQFWEEAAAEVAKAHAAGGAAAPAKAAERCSERWRQLARQQRASTQEVVVMRDDFLSAMRQHGLEWLATAAQQSIPFVPPRKVGKTPTAKAKAVKPKPEAAKPEVLEPEAAADEGAGADDAGGMAAGRDDSLPPLVPPGEGGHWWEQPEGGVDEQSEAVLDELIDLYADQHGALPTQDLMRNWMDTLQSATEEASTNPLDSGLG